MIEDSRHPTDWPAGISNLPIGIDELIGKIILVGSCRRLLVRQNRPTMISFGKHAGKGIVGAELSGGDDSPAAPEQALKYITGCIRRFVADLWVTGEVR
jgi:hypothetical protein